MGSVPLGPEPEAICVGPRRGEDGTHRLLGGVDTRPDIDAAAGLGEIGRPRPSAGLHGNNLERVMYDFATCCRTGGNGMKRQSTPPCSPGVQPVVRLIICSLLTARR